MSTRATIQFKDDDEIYYVYRHSDGHPDNVERNIQEVLKAVEGRWSGAEMGTLVSFFLGYYFDHNRRLPHYDLTTAFHGDESYRYYVEWDGKNKRYSYHYK